MKTRKMLSAIAMTLSLSAGLHTTEAWADDREVQPSLGHAREGAGEEHLIVGSLLAATSVDVYQLSCKGAASKCATADVRDIGPVNDTKFSVTLVGLSGGLQGKADSEISPAGGLSAIAQLCRPGVGPFKSYVVIAEANTRGFENYDSMMNCKTALGAAVAHAVVNTQNQ